MTTQDSKVSLTANLGDLRAFDDHKKAVCDFLEDKGWTSVAIWGVGLNGRYLFSLLAGTAVRVSSIYDSMATGKFGGLTIDNPLRSPDSKDSKLILTSKPLILAVNRDAVGVEALVRRLTELKVDFVFFEALAMNKSVPKTGPVGRQNPAYPRMSLEGALSQLKVAGFEPRTILDVGAALGHWTAAAAKVFPSATFLMFEPLKAEFEPFLKHFMNANRDLDCRAIYSAVSGENGEVMMNVHDDWTSSSLLKETEGKQVDGNERIVPCCRLSDTIAMQACDPPFLLKVDTQGNELAVLNGCGNLLDQCEVIILETSFFPFFKSGPLFHEVVEYMKERGFIIHDIITLHYKLLDDSLAQADVLFVNEKSKLHETVEFATPEQRERKVSAFEKSIASVKALLD